jgi:hypothetical protein
MTDRGPLVADHLDPHEDAGQKLGDARGTSHAIGDYQRPVGAPVDSGGGHAGRRPAEPSDLPLQSARIGAVAR